MVQAGKIMMNRYRYGAPLVGLLVVAIIGAGCAASQSTASTTNPNPSSPIGVSSPVACNLQGGSLAAGRECLRRPDLLLFDRDGTTISSTPWPIVSNQYVCQDPNAVNDSCPANSPTGQNTAAAYGSMSGAPGSVGP